MTPLFAQGAFTIDPNATPEQLKRKRELIAAMMPQYGKARYVGEGIGQALYGIGAGIQNRKLDKAEGAGTAGATDLFSRIVGGASAQPGGFSMIGQPPSGGGASPISSPPAQSTTSPDPQYPVGVDALPQPEMTPGGFALGQKNNSYIPEDIKNGIFAGESGGDYNALFGFANRPGGKFQNVKLTDMTVDQALEFANPQGEYGQTVKGQIGRVATPMGAYQIVGTTLKAAKDGLGLTGNEQMTEDLQDRLGGWILAEQGTGAWEGYKGPRDSYTPASGGSTTMSAQNSPIQLASGGADLAPLYEALGNPWLTEQQRGVITSMIAQQQGAPMQALEMQNAQIGLQKSQLELDALRNPKPGFRTLSAQEAASLGLPEGGVYQAGPDGQIVTASKGQGQGDVPSEFAALDLRAKASGLQPGTPEYQDFMRTGGRRGNAVPAAFEALDLQAQAAGLIPGTPEYQEYMLTKGADEIAKAKAVGTAAGESIATAPAQIENADVALKGIEDIRNSPALGAGTGMSALFNGIPGTARRGFQAQVDQLKGGAFLTAIQQLQGMGALSNSEGQTATAAIARLDTAQREEDFLRALDDYEAIVKIGRERAAGKLKTEKPAPKLKRMKYNPATGELE